MPSRRYNDDLNYSNPNRRHGAHHRKRRRRQARRQGQQLPMDHYDPRVGQPQRLPMHGYYDPRVGQRRPKKRGFFGHSNNGVIGAVAGAC